jgi:GDP-D-mannose dehydratase
MKKALITGQDGAYLVEFLLKNDMRFMVLNDGSL